MLSLDISHVLQIFVINEVISVVHPMKVYQFSPGNTEWNSQAYLNSPVLKSSTELTFCYRVKIYRFIPTIYWINVFQYERSGDATCCEFRSMWTSTGPIFILRNQFVSLSNVEVKLMRWYHVCFTFHYIRSNYKAVMDGEVISEGWHNNTFRALRGNGTFKAANGGFEVCTDNCSGFFSGEITDLQIWSKEFSTEELIRITTCHNRSSAGDIVNWETAEWITANVNTFDLSLAQICDEREDSFMAFPDVRPFINVMEFCRSFGAEMATPKSVQDQNELMNATDFFFRDKVCYRFWIGWSDEWTEGTFIDVNKYLVNNNHNNNKRSQKVSPLPQEMQQYWKNGEPNGGRLESCAEIRSDGSWNDMPCSDKTKGCTACYFRKRPLLSLRGLCKSSIFDNKYILTKEYINRKLMFKGYFRTSITWIVDANQTIQAPSTSEQGDQAPPTGSWQIQSVTSNSTYGVLMSKWSTQYPIGRQEWTIYGDQCFFGENVIVNLTLTTCVEGEFTCDSGDCVPFDQRCNNAMDCADSSDEVECSILSLPEGYRKSSNPQSTDMDNQLLTINMDLLINSFPEIDVNRMKMKVDFVLTLTWLDPRLRYFNLKESFSLNPLSLEEMDLLWFPEVLFTNTDGNEVSLVDQSTENYVLKEGKGEYMDVDGIRETLIFQGEDNHLMSQRKYTIDFSCNFELQDYPFDVQTCEMNLKLKKPTRNVAVINLREFAYEGALDLLEYKVMNTSEEKEYECGKQSLASCSRVMITLKRRVGNQLLNTYLPTVCLLLIIYLSHFFKLDHQDTRIMVALTGMLVIASLFVSTSASLPRTSYMKTIDIWMIFCFLLPFFEVILHTFVEFCAPEPESVNAPWVPMNAKLAFVERSSEKTSSSRWRNEKTQLRIDYFARIIVPIVFFAFNIYHWGDAFAKGGIEV